jgi:Kef-type K+ transport system membrane component KefB
LKKVLLFSGLLVAGLIASQLLPGLLGGAYGTVAGVVTFLTMACLSFIMIHVGYEFELDKSKLGSYGWDYVVAMTAAAFPWIFVTLYFVYVMLPHDAWSQMAAWKETLLAGRFAAPTSAGVLFSMLAAAGLSATWLFRKARILAIFDDLDTVLLMVPLKMLMVGFAWQLVGIVGAMAVLLWIAWTWLHRWLLPVSWPWVIGYAVAITVVSEVVYIGSLKIDSEVPIHLEVLLPAFVLGCTLRRPAGTDPHADDVREGHQEGPESSAEQRASTIISAVFMVLVGLSMPSFSGEPPPVALDDPAVENTLRLTASQPVPSWGTILLHVAAITALCNVGKMFPAFCYRNEAHWRERLAIAIGMWPRGEVGAGVLVVSIGYGIGGPILTVAVLSLALNLLLTGIFVVIVKKLIEPVTASSSA